MNREHTMFEYVASLLIGAGLFYVGYLGYKEQPIPKNSFMALMGVGVFVIIYHAYCYVKCKYMSENMTLLDSEEHTVIGVDGKPMA